MVCVCVCVCVMCVCVMCVCVMCVCVCVLVGEAFVSAHTTQFTHTHHSEKSPY